MRTIYLTIAALVLALIGLGHMASTADAQTQVYRDAYGRPVLTMGPPGGSQQHYRRPQQRQHMHRPHMRPKYVNPGYRQYGGRDASPRYYQRGGHAGHQHQQGGAMRRVIVKRTISHGAAFATGAVGGAAVIKRPMPPLQPQIPSVDTRSAPGAIAVHGAQGIRYTGGPGSCTRSDGSMGRAGLSPDGQPACYRF